MTYLSLASERSVSIEKTVDIKTVAPPPIMVRNQAAQTRRSGKIHQNQETARTEPTAITKPRMQMRRTGLRP